VTVERARGLALHVFSDEIGAPVLPPKTISFFDVAEEISRITQKGDKVFSTMTSGLMLYFLSDRDSIGGKANCYVWQTVQGTTTSNALEDFSDVDLTRMIQQERPKAIIVEPDDVETKRFAINWPGAWNFILSRYRVLETIGPYQIYVPDTQR
jgi:hypothetical protein